MIELKKIISTFIGKSIEEINDKTIIDKTVVKGSILIHRMFASLAAKGFKLNDYSNIKTFGDLIYNLEIPQQLPKNTEEIPEVTTQINANLSIKGIGIDIENVSLMPIASDFREDEFYIQNFTSNEISYCIMKLNPYESFAGLFCLKEAIFKSNNSIFINKSFNQIEITHADNGAPICPGYILSLSHSNDVVVAVSISIIC
jgi:phosphopantetheine--protein transferase-like protein